MSCPKNSSCLACAHFGAMLIDEFADDGAQLIRSQNKTNAHTQNASEGLRADKFTSDNAKGLCDPLFEVKRITAHHSHDIRAPSSANLFIAILHDFVRTGLDKHVGLFLIDCNIFIHDSLKSHDCTVCFTCQSQYSHGGIIETKNSSMIQHIYLSLSGGFLPGYAFFPFSKTGYVNFCCSDKNSNESSERNCLKNLWQHKACL
jgi:hypothetical protein